MFHTTSETHQHLFVSDAFSIPLHFCTDICILPLRSLAREQTNCTICIHLVSKYYPQQLKVSIDHSQKPRYPNFPLSWCPLLLVDACASLLLLLWSTRRVQARNFTNPRRHFILDGHRGYCFCWRLKRQGSGKNRSCCLGQGSRVLCSNKRGFDVYYNKSSFRCWARVLRLLMFYFTFHRIPHECWIVDAVFYIHFNVIVTSKWWKRSYLENKIKFNSQQWNYKVAVEWVCT